MTTLVVNGINIAALTDEELFDMLQIEGFSPGPIVDSTRKLYQKKLAQVLRHEPRRNYSDLSNNEEDEVEEHNDSVFYSSSSNVSTDLTRRPIVRSSLPYQGTTSYRRHIHSVVEQEVQVPKQSHSARSKVIIAVIVAIVFCVLILIYQNMEDNIKNPIPTGI